MQFENEDIMLYPLVSDRYKVVLVDAMDIIGLMVIYSFLIGIFSNEAPSWVRLVLFSTVLLYKPLAISFFGKTIGHWSGNLKVVLEADRSKKVPMLLALARTVLKYVLGIISLFSITAQNRGRALHDMATGSIVPFDNK